MELEQTNPTPARRIRLTSEQRRQQVLVTAVRLFHQKGYARTSLQEIADEIGITKAAVYYHFSGKEEILLLSYHEIVTNGIAIAAELASRPLPASDRLALIVGALASRVVTYRETNALFDMERASLSSESRAKIRAAEREYENIVKGVFREGLASGDFSGDPDIVVNTLLAACGSVHRWHRQDSAELNNAVVVGVSEFLSNGYRSRRDA